MAETGARVDALEAELKLLKGEIKKTLVDIRTVVMKVEGPLNGGAEARDAAAATAPLLKELREQLDEIRQEKRSENQDLRAQLEDLRNQKQSETDDFRKQFEELRKVRQEPARAEPQSSSQVPQPGAAQPQMATAGAFSGPVGGGPEGRAAMHTSAFVPEPPQPRQQQLGTAESRGGAADARQEGRPPEPQAGESAAPRSHKDSHQKGPADSSSRGERRTGPATNGKSPSAGKGARNGAAPRNTPKYASRYGALMKMPERNGYRNGHGPQTPFAVKAGWEKAMLAAREELFDLADMPGASQNVNFLTNLVHWVSMAKGRLGEDKLMPLLDLYLTTGTPAYGLKEMVAHISAMTGEATAPEDQKAAPQPVAQDWIDLMLQLHGIVMGSEVLSRLEEMQDHDDEDKDER